MVTGLGSTEQTSKGLPNRLDRVNAAINPLASPRFASAC
jgi:hypothetical protein